MFTLINYIKSYENKLSETQQAETQFLDREIYTSENYNQNSFTKIIMNKIKDTKKLIELLNKSTSEIKNEILNKINSNFNNHIILISKLQTVDYLLENIEKPLKVVKQKFQNKIEIITKNEDEIKSILEYLIENDKILHNAKISFNYFKLINQSNQIKAVIQKKQESSIIKNIIDNNENVTLLSAYDFIKTFLIENFRILNLNQKIKNISEDLKLNILNNSQNLSNNDLNTIFSTENALNFYNKITEEDENSYSTLDKILEICLNEIIKKVNEKNKMEIFLYKNLIDLLFKCYMTQYKLMDFFEKVKVTYFITEINDVFNKENSNNAINNQILSQGSQINNNSLEKRIKIFQNIIKIKYEFLLEICKNKKKEFYLISILGPLFNKLNSEKHIFNCVDAEVFRINLQSILNFLNNFPIKSNDKKEDINYTSELTENIQEKIFLNENIEKEKFYLESISNNIILFMQNFSFFTYFQFLQNDITKLFINNPIITEKNPFIVQIDYENDNLKYEKVEDLRKYFFNYSNFLFNFNKFIENIFKEKKLFVKILPNFLNYIISCFNFISSKQNEFIVNNSFLKYYLKEFYKNSENISVNLNIQDYLRNLNNYFGNIQNLESLLIKDISQEKFLFSNQEDFRNLENKISKLCENLKNYKPHYDLINSENFTDLLEKNHYSSLELENLRKSNKY